MSDQNEFKVTVTPPEDMSRNGPLPNIPYDPLPLGQDVTDGLRETIYHDAPSPRDSAFSTPPVEMSDFADSHLPSGAAQPRFLGAALYDEGGINPRESYASQGTNRSSPSMAASSVYALNAAQGQPTSQGDYAGSYRDDPQDSEYLAGVADSPRYMSEKRSAYAQGPSKSKRTVIILSSLGALALIIVAVVVPVYFTVIKPKNQQNDATTNPASPTSSSGGGKPAVAAAVTGGDGSVVTMDDGTTFTYSNSFGGYWYWDPEDPFNNGAKAQSWTPALNETFQYGTNRIWGVNLGGWLTTEPFIAPALYQKYLKSTPTPVDEWTLSEAMAADTSAGGGLQQLETHYSTFITERDFAAIAGAGLNFVRIPVPWWAIETRGNEPFLPKVSWTYFLKAIRWARKYGLRINLDFHALPGSQNGWNHSGRLGSVNVLNGPMGVANAQRSLDYVRIFAEFISQPEYSDVVTIFGITNEPQGTMVGQSQLSSYYVQAYNNVREASGIGEGKGPYVSFHDGFLGTAQWAGFLPNSDRSAMDTHPYICFGGQSAAPMSSYAQTPCNAWGSMMNTSMGAFGLSTAGEFSNAVTDCGLYVNGVGLGTRYEGNYTPGNWPAIGSCDPWTDWQAWNSSMKEDIMQFALASMDALQNWFFWTWKIGNSSTTGVVESPQWSYSLGLENGWMPKDPRVAVGTCSNQNIWSPPLQAWQTGGAGAGDLASGLSASYPWPPATISNAGAASLLPTYTPTGTVATLPGPTFTLTSGSQTKTASAGDGWENPSDTAKGMVGIATCSYLDPWIGPSAAPPSPLCSAGSAASARAIANDVPRAQITTPPEA